MDPNTVVLDISSDEDVVNWIDDKNERGVGDDDTHNWLTEILGEVTENEETEKKSKSKLKLNLKPSVVDLDDDDDDDDDCVMLDNDPNEDLEIVNGDQKSGGGDDDIVVVSEKGQVACRDYPHPRHLCCKFPFATTPNQSHCEQCYCYVCDSLAPCVFWDNGSTINDHCHATDKDKFWTLARENAKKGSKPIKPVSRVTPVDQYRPPLLPPVDPYSLPPATVQSQNQIPMLGLNHTPANYQPPSIINQNQNQNHILSSRNRLHSNLVSDYLRRRPQNQSGTLRAHRTSFKTTGSAPVATTANRNPNGLNRGNFGNPTRQQNQNQNYNVNVNEMLSELDTLLGSLQPSPVSYPPQSQNYSSSTVNQPLLPPLPQFVNHPNPNFQSRVNSIPFPENSPYQPNVVPPTYTGPTQSTYPLRSNTRVDSPLVPATTGYPQNLPQETQPQVDPGIQDYGLNTTLDGAMNGPSTGPVSNNLAEFPYDWIFEDQPVEAGFMDMQGVYGLGLNEFSSDSTFIDTGLIFEY